MPDARELARRERLDVLWGAFVDCADSFSCTEIEAIADLYRDAGWTEEQVLPLLRSHAWDDDEGDPHWSLVHFGCVECHGTGLHVSPQEIGEPVIYGVERHDGCGSLAGGDLEAAAFIALCHPQYRWISYRTADRQVFNLDARRWRSDGEYPAIAFAAPILLSTPEGHLEALKALETP